MDLRRIIRNLDWWLIFAVLALMGCGLGLIDSATHSFSVSTGKSWHVNRQSTFMLIAIFLAICTLRFDYRILKNYATPFYIFNVLILVAVMFFGTTQLGAQRWIQIGGFTVQPSEFAKVFLIICLAAFMERRIEWLEDFKDYIPVFLYIFLPFILVLKQPDLGTSLTFMAILLGMIFVSGFKIRWFVWCTTLFVSLMPLIWRFVLKDYHSQNSVHSYKIGLTDGALTAAAEALGTLFETVEVNTSKNADKYDYLAELNYTVSNGKTDSLESVQWFSGQPPILETRVLIELYDTHTNQKVFSMFASRQNRVEMTDASAVTQRVENKGKTLFLPVTGPVYTQQFGDDLRYTLARDLSQCLTEIAETLQQNRALFAAPTQNNVK